MLEKGSRYGVDGVAELKESFANDGARQLGWRVQRVAKAPHVAIARGMLVPCGDSNLEPIGAEVPNIYSYMSLSRVWWSAVGKASDGM